MLLNIQMDKKIEKRCLELISKSSELQIRAKDEKSKLVKKRLLKVARHLEKHAEKLMERANGKESN